MARSLPGPRLAPIVFSIRPPQSLFPTRLKSSHRRRNARLVALSIRACSPKSNHSSEVDECCKVITNKKKPKYATWLTFDNNESFMIVPLEPYDATKTCSTGAVDTVHTLIFLTYVASLYAPVSRDLIFH